MIKFFIGVIALIGLYKSARITYIHFIKNSTKAEALIYSNIAMSIFGFLFAVLLYLLKHYGYYPD